MARRPGPSARLLALREAETTAFDPGVIGRPIESLTPAKGRGDDVRVRVAGRSLFRIARDAAERCDLHLGTEWTVALATRAIGEAETSLAVGYALRSLGARSRTASQLKRSLRTRGHTDTAIERTIAWLVERRFLDDRRHAESMVRAELLRKPAGRRLLEAKLYRAGIDRATAAEVIAEALSEHDAKDDAVALATKWARTNAARLDPDVAKRRLFAHLARRGFDPDAARHATERALGQIDA